MPAIIEERTMDGNLPGRDGWDFYLSSLRDYLETGKGNPGGLRPRGPN